MQRRKFYMDIIAYFLQNCYRNFTDFYNSYALLIAALFFSRQLVIMPRFFSVSIAKIAILFLFCRK